MTERNSDSGINRRSVLKRTGSFAAIGSLGLTNTVAATSTESNKPGWEAKDVNWLPSNEVAQLLQHAMSPQYVQDLKSLLLNEGLQPAPNQVAGAQIVTSSDEVNSFKPVHVLLPFVKNGRSQKDEKSVKGILDVTVIENDGERQVIGGLGASINDSGSEGTVKLLGNVPESGQGMNTFSAGASSETQSAPVAGVIDEVTPSERVTTQVSLPCATCQIMYDTICSYFGASVTNSVCYAAGAACFGGGGNIPGAIGCWGACTLVVGAIGVYGCFYSGNYVCNQIEEAGC